MTILTTKLILKKAQRSHCSCEEGLVQIQPARRRKSGNRSIGALLCLSVLALLVAAVGLGSGLMVYRQYLRSINPRHYQGFCTIPFNSKYVDSMLLDPNLRSQPIRFSAEPDVQVVSLLDEESSDDVLNLLREELDIGGNVEKISVFDNGRRVNFTHDFDSNFTGIVDEERCYIMDLDQDVVASPGMFVVGIERDERFDLTPVRTALRAALPPLKDPSELLQGVTFFLDNCLHRPLYRLYKDENIIIRKRSADEPPHDYIQFSGKHIQEIEITNLADLLQHEREVRERRSLA